MSEVFLRPVEIVDGDNAFTIDDGAGGDVITVPVGSYGSMLSVLWKINERLEAENANYSLTLGADFKTTIALDGGTYSINFGDGILQAMLGFTTVPTAVQTATSEKTISHMWLPTYARTNQEYFRRDHTRSVHGTTLANGMFSGLATETPNVREMTYSYAYEPAANVALEFATDALDETRCWSEFVYEARAVTVTDADRVPVKGFYVYPDKTDAAIVANVTTDEGLDLNYTTSPDTHVFCHLTSRQPAPRPSLPNTRLRYDCEINCISIDPDDTPSWTIPVVVP